MLALIQNIYGYLNSDEKCIYTAIKTLQLVQLSLISTVFHADKCPNTNKCPVPFTSRNSSLSGLLPKSFEFIINYNCKYHSQYKTHL